MRIVCIGDSITAGQHLDEGFSPWPGLLRDAEVFAKGVPGDTTRMGLERFPQDVQSLVPDLVVIQFGHNDANRWLTDRGLPRVSLPAYVANLVEMVERVRIFDAVPILCALTPSTRSAEHGRDCERYDAALRGVARDLGVQLADVRPAIHETHLLDGLHLNFDGHLAYAAIVGALL